MKYNLKPVRIPLLVLGGGMIGALVRAGLYAIGEDSKGLLIRSHPLHILCWVIAALVAAAAAAAVWKLEGSNSYHHNFPASKRPFIPTIAAACGILLTALQALPVTENTLGTVWAVLGLLAAPALAFTAFCRRGGKKPSFFFHAAVCLFYAAHLMCQYQLWSGNPQLPDYDFQLLACVFLTLTAYHHMAFDAGLGRRRMQLYCGLMAGFFCILSCVRSGFPLLYLTSGIWALCSLCSLTPPARHHSPEENKEEA